MAGSALEVAPPVVDSPGKGKFRPASSQIHPQFRLFLPLRLADAKGRQGAFHSLPQVARGVGSAQLRQGERVVQGSLPVQGQAE